MFNKGLPQRARVARGRRLNPDSYPEWTRAQDVLVACSGHSRRRGGDAREERCQRKLDCGEEEESTRYAELSRSSPGAPQLSASRDRGVRPLQPGRRRRGAHSEPLAQAFSQLPLVRREHEHAAGASLFRCLTVSLFSFPTLVLVRILRIRVSKILKIIRYTNAD